MNTLDYFQQKFDLDLSQRTMPIAIPNFGRIQLANLLKELDFKIGVEVGVARGDYSKVLAQSNPQMEWYGVDPFSPQPGYRDYVRQQTFSSLKQDAHGKLDSFKNYTFIEKTSLEAAKDFTNNSLDFVYIDADHSFRAVTDDIDEWIRKVRPGGILAGHDFATSRGNARMHVKQVVAAYMRAWALEPWFVLGNEANNEGLIRDKPRSWMWIK